MPVYGNAQQAQQVALWLLEKLLKISISQILLVSDLELTLHQSQLLEQWLDELVNKHKPYQYILGSVPFLDLDVLVEPPILIPRLETEYWVNLLIQRFANFKNEQFKILDLCSGSGCIALSLAKFFRNSQVTAVDISHAACDLIVKNLAHNQITNVEVLQSDLCQKLSSQKFDLIIANPPYIPKLVYDKLEPSVKLWEDQQALVSPDHDLAIIANIIKLAPEYLQAKCTPISSLWLEVDSTQGDSVNTLMQGKFKQTELILDQFGRPRVIVGKN